MKLRNIILSLSIASMAFLASCGDKTSSSSSPKPTISLKAGAGLISATGNIPMDSSLSTILTFNVVSTAGSDAMKNIVITAKLTNGSTKTILDTALITKNIDFTKSIVATGSVGDVVEYTFTANDNNGQSASYPISITLVPGYWQLVREDDQKVYNALAVGFNSAYNLDEAQALTAGTPDFVPGKKDIIDKTPTGAAQWANTWGSGNGSKFAKCTANDFNNAASANFLYTLWNTYKSKATDQISGMKVGDVYMVKTGQNVPFGLYLLNITAVVDLPAAGNNNDYIVFNLIRYKP